MAWINLVVVVSILLLAAVMIAARRQREPYANELGPPAWQMGSLGDTAGVAQHDRESLQEPYGGVVAKKMFPTGSHTVRKYRSRFERIKPLLGLPPTFGFLVEANSAYPRGHSQEVSWVAIQIARHMGLSQAEIEEVRLAGLVHDVGKLGVPLQVLNKPSSLTAEEFEIMKSHSARGEKMLEPLGVKEIGCIVRHHHERYDGTGYPDGLAGDRIPLGARIVAVSESFQGMISDVPYKSALTFDDAVAELRRGSGTRFDPKVIAAFLDWIRIHGDPREQV
ncbi:MAG: HD-GYP domain-containing protein [Terriglobia bacterium]